jgi:hypothetical protein
MDEGDTEADSGSATVVHGFSYVIGCATGACVAASKAGQ